MLTASYDYKARCVLGRSRLLRRLPVPINRWIHNPFPIRFLPNSSSPSLYNQNLKRFEKHSGFPINRWGLSLKSMNSYAQSETNFAAIEAFTSRYVAIPTRTSDPPFMKLVITHDFNFQMLLVKYVPSRAHTSATMPQWLESLWHTCLIDP